MRHAILAPHSAHRTFYKYDREASEASTEAADQEFIDDHLIPHPHVVENHCARVWSVQSAIDRVKGVCKKSWIGVLLSGESESL